MSILDENKVDGLAVTDDSKGLILLLADHLEWTEEYEHLILLQNKINAYITFWENKQYKQVNKKLRPEYCIVEWHALYEPTEKALAFLEQVNKQTSDILFQVQYSVQ